MLQTCLKALLVGLLGVNFVQAAELRVLALGDSITEGYGVALPQSYPALVESSLKAGFPDVRVINAGIGGSTSASAVSRLRWHLRARPSVVLLALGANDMLRGLPVKSCENHLRAALQLLQQNQIPVILAGMKAPPNYGETYQREFEAIYPRLAGEFRIPLIPFLLEGVGGKRELNQEDGIHPNEKGHAAIARLVEPYLRKALEPR